MRILRFLPPILFGVVVGGVLGWIITGDWIYTIVFAASLGPAIIVPMALGLARRGTLGESDGGFAAGRVESVRRLGTTPDGAQQVDVRVSVFSRDDSPYQTTMRAVVEDEGIRALRTGALLPVLRLGPRVRPDVSYVPSPPPEWAQRLDALRAESTTLPPASDVPPWETATTTTPGTPKPGTPRRGPAALVGLALVAATAALVLIPAYPSIARGFNNIAQGRWDGSNMVTGLYQQESVDQMVAAAGTTQFTSVNFYPSYIIGEAISRDDPEFVDEVQWRYGRAWVEGPAFIQPADIPEQLFDVAGLDFSMVAQSAQDAIARAQIPDPESVYGFVRLDDDRGVPIISVTVTGAYESAYYDYTFDGELIGGSGS